MNIKFDKVKDYAFSLTKADIGVLQLLLVDDIKDYKIFIYSKVSDLSLRTESFDEFINNKGTPEKFDYLSINIDLYDSKNDIDNSIDISSYSEINRTKLSVSGKEQTWVLGIFNKLSEILSNLEKERKNSSNQNNFASKKKYQQKDDIKACVLTKDDTIELINIMQNDIPEGGTSRLHIRTELKDAKIESNNIHDFFEHVDNLDKLSDFTAYVSGKDDIFIHITLGAFYAGVSVTGNNEVWVKGKYSQLLDFFKKKRIWYWFLHGPFIGVALLSSLISVYAIIYSISPTNVLILTLSSISFIAWAFAITFHIRGNLLPKAYIDFRPKRPRINKEDISLFVALLTLGFYLYELFFR